MKEEGSELLDDLEPELVRNLDPIYQRLLEIWRKARGKQKGES